MYLMREIVPNCVSIELVTTCCVVASHRLRPLCDSRDKAIKGQPITTTAFQYQKSSKLKYTLKDLT